MCKPQQEEAAAQELLLQQQRCKQQQLPTCLPAGWRWLQLWQQHWHKPWLLNSSNLKLKIAQIQINVRGILMNVRKKIINLLAWLQKYKKKFECELQQIMWLCSLRAYRMVLRLPHATSCMRQANMWCTVSQKKMFVYLI